MHPSESHPHVSEPAQAPASATIVIADDDGGNRGLLARLLTREGYVVHTAPDGAAALEIIHATRPDLVLSDVMMPKLNGFELCQRLKMDPLTRFVPVVLVTGLAERRHRIAGIDAGADDFLTKPIDAHELHARVRSLLRLKRYTDDLDSAQSVILSLALTVEARDPSTAGHCQRMAAYSAAFGRRLGLSGEDVTALHHAGYLHDVGKIGIPDAILLKPGRLTAAEYDDMKRHPVIGEALCGDLRLLRLVRPIVRHHHERQDGSGYPDGLAGDDVPLLAQLVAIVDVYDALSTDRVYKRAMTIESTYRELRAEAARGWHRVDLVEEFIAMAEAGALQS